MASATRTSPYELQFYRDIHRVSLHGALIRSAWQRRVSCPAPRSTSPYANRIFIFISRFVVVSVLSVRHQTPVAKRTCNPVYNPKDATFDYPLYFSLADKLGVIELVIWDKDMLKKDYLGEVSIPLEDWFKHGNCYAFSDPENKVCISYLTCGITTEAQHAVPHVGCSRSMCPWCLLASPLRPRVRSAFSSASSIRPTLPRSWNSRTSTTSSSSSLAPVSPPHPL